MANEFMSGAQGALGGAGTGAAMGTALLPGVGTVVGALLGGTIGAFSGASKAKDQNNALGMLNAVPNIDPNQVIFKDQLYREKKAVESGFTTDFQVARDIIGKSEAGGMSVAAEMAQSNPALALMMMNQIGQGTDTAVNKALGTIGTRGMGYTSMIGDLIDKMSQRKIQVDLLKAQSALAISTKGMQDFNANSNAGMMKLLDPSVMGGFKAFGGMFAGSGSGISNFNTDQVAAMLAENPNAF
jgi:hypothetical protein